MRPATTAPSHRITLLKIIITGLLALFTLLSLSACQKEDPQARNAGDDYETRANGEKIYLKYCKLCHGVDGTLSLNGAANLQKSGLPKDETRRIIAEGRNTMQPYKGILSEQELEAVTSYVLKMRK